MGDTLYKRYNSTLRAAWVVAVVIGVFLAQSILITKNVFAVENADGPAAEKAAMVAACFREFDFQSVVPKGDAENENLFGKFTGSEKHFGNNYSAGNQRSEVTVPASKLVASDESMECRSVLGSLLQILGTNYDDFFSKYYEPIDDNDDGKFNDYGFKNGVSSSTIEEDIRKAVADAGLWTHGGLSPGTMPTGYIKAVLTPLFAECFIESDQNADFTFNGQNYLYVGGDGHDERADQRVGFLLDPPDGIWSCKEMGEKLESTSAIYGQPPATLADIVLGDAVSDEEVAEVPGGGGGGGGGGEDSGEQGANANCMASSKGFGLAWVLCPVYNIMETFMNKMLNYIADMMYSKLDEGDVPELRNAWANMRNIANVMFVFALLIVIIGQAVRGSW